jgi:hypothetical protein
VNRDHPGQRLTTCREGLRLLIYSVPIFMASLKNADAGRPLEGGWSESGEEINLQAICRGFANSAELKIDGG